MCGDLESFVKLVSDTRRDFMDGSSSIAFSWAREQAKEKGGAYHFGCVV